MHSAAARSWLPSELRTRSGRAASPPGANRRTVAFIADTNAATRMWPRLQPDVPRLQPSATQELRAADAVEDDKALSSVPLAGGQGSSLPPMPKVELPLLPTYSLIGLTYLLTFVRSYVRTYLVRTYILGFFLRTQVGMPKLELPKGLPKLPKLPF